MGTLLQHQFSAPQRLWLEHAARTANFDPRVARAKLFDQLPAEFNPAQIDRRFYRDDRITLLGLRLFCPEAPILANAERIALAVRDEIRRSPGIDEITLDKLADLSKLPKADAYYATSALTEIVPFFTGSSKGADHGGTTRFFLTGPHGYDAPLQFTTIDAAMERSYQLEGVLPSIAPLLTVRTEGASGRRRGQARTTKRATAFVIMAMDPHKPELTDVLDTIRDVCASFGIKAHRADEIQHQDQITNVILEEIRSCEYLIADLTHERPNVYYEVGFAHAIDKKPILFRKSGTPLHFDLAVHNVPEYRNNADLRELLTKRYEAMLGRTADALLTLAKLKR
jgi:nucleoside 2-deoxyribosyltransferase